MRSHSPSRFPRSVRRQLRMRRPARSAAALAAPASSGYGCQLNMQRISTRMASGCACSAVFRAFLQRRKHQSQGPAWKAECRRPASQRPAGQRHSCRSAGRRPWRGDICPCACVPARRSAPGRPAARRLRERAERPARRRPSSCGGSDRSRRPEDRLAKAFCAVSAASSCSVSGVFGDKARHLRRELIGKTHARPEIPAAALRQRVDHGGGEHGVDIRIAAGQRSAARPASADSGRRRRTSPPLEVEQRGRSARRTARCRSGGHRRPAPSWPQPELLRADPVQADAQTHACASAGRKRSRLATMRWTFSGRRFASVHRKVCDARIGQQVKIVEEEIARLRSGQPAAQAVRQQPCARGIGQGSRSHAGTGTRRGQRPPARFAREWQGGRNRR